ncbi:MAG: transglutaminase domain-containing protein [Gammaproteobacteria bacterium]|nr:transglutaminase domain-containing protein [Gammaproteobacteria bacterium]
MSRALPDRVPERRLDSVRAVGGRASPPAEAEVPVLFDLRCPALMLGAAILVWGMATGYVQLAVLMAVLVESSRLIRFRFDFSETDLARVSDLTTVGLLLLVVYQFDVHRMYGVFAVLELLPLALFPLLMTQVYATTPNVSVGSLFMSVRRAYRRGMIERPPRIDVRLIFVMFCLLAASAGDGRGRVLFVASTVLLVWLLLVNRPAHVRLHRSLLALGFGLTAAAAIHAATLWGRQALEPLIAQWVEEYVQDRSDPYRANTALGNLGRLKGSSRIMLRVDAQRGQPVPLLREALYRTFSNNVWIAMGGELADLQPDSEGVRWQLGPPARPTQSIYVTRSIERGRALVAMPTGAFAVDELPVERVQRNRLGTTRVEQGPNLVRYKVLYAPAGETLPPDERDLDIPSHERPVLDTVVESLGLRQMSEREALLALQRYFAREFDYSLQIDVRRFENSPIIDFLQRTRAGHCEYFASATVLLLRSIGIPARYATGYSVHEYSELEGSFVARNRDAHSWAVAYVDGRWIDVDNTPGSWLQIESERLPWWTEVRDLMSFVRFRFGTWRLQASESETRRDWVLALAAILVLLLVWRLRNSRVRRDEGSAIGGGARPLGRDSEMFEVARVLSAVGGARRGHESLAAWLSRLRADSVSAAEPATDSESDADAQSPACLRAALDSELLDQMLALHLQLRFDPDGLAPASRERLRALARQWLSEHGQLDDGRRRRRSWAVTGRAPKSNQAASGIE